MIFISTGSQLPFDRLVKIIDELIDEKIINEEVIVQSKTKASFNNFTPLENISKTDFIKNVQDARLIISHAGMGNLLTCLQQKKNFILFPRNKLFGEHRTNHQMNIAQYLLNQKISICFSKKCLISALQNKRNNQLTIRVSQLQQNLKSLFDEYL